MPLNSAGINAILEDGNEAVIWVAVGDGQTSGDQTSAARHQLASTVSGGVLTATGVPYAFTGTPGDGATNALFYSASSGGTFYGYDALTGDQAFNASGDYSITSLTITGSSTEGRAMAQTLFTSQIPVSQDLTDGIVLMLGTYITPAVDGTVTALRFRFPETTQAPVKAALFRVDNSTKLSGGTDPVFTSPVLDDWNEVALASPVIVSAGVEICAAVRVLRYTNSAGGGTPLPVTNGDLSALASAGHYSTFDPDTSVTFPNNLASDDACYFTDIVFQAAVPAEGSAAAGLGLAVATSGGRASAGATAAGLGLAVAAVGGRTAQGSVTLSLGLGLAGAGARASGGATALGLGLAVVARGANGDAGRPVATYPWTPRPVRSFSEVTP